jgi:hypothetical protein
VISASCLALLRLLLLLLHFGVISILLLLLRLGRCLLLLG